MKESIRPLLVLSLLAVPAFAQPVVTGALNTASYTVPGFPNSGLAQGSMIAIFGRNLGPAALTAASTFPLPTSIGGTSAKIAVGGQSVDLIMTYSVAGQAGAIVPSNTPVGSGQLTVTFNGQTSANFPVNIVATQFGIFTINQGGSGPAVVQNFNSQTDTPVNTVLNSAKPGQTMILWGTGLGAIQGSDAGLPPTSGLNTPVEVLVGGRSARVVYKGRSGCCSGVDQIVFEIPAGVDGCYVPMVVKSGNVVSNFASLAVSPNGGACSDPLSYSAADLAKLQSGTGLRVGSVNLAKATMKMTVPIIGSIENTSEVGSGVFRGYTADQLIASRGTGGNSTSIGACSVFTYSGEGGTPADPIQARVLDAGPRLDLTGPAGTKQITKGSTGDYLAVLSSNTPGLPGGIPGLPGGIGGGGGAAAFITAGSYTANNGAGGADVGGFSTNLTIPGNFSWTNESSINNVPRSSDLLITWTGAPGDAYAYITGGSFNDAANVGASFFCMERGSVGRFSVPSAVLLALPQSTSIEGIPTGQLMVGFTSNPSRFNATGLDVGIFSYSIVNGKNLNYQ